MDQEIVKIKDVLLVAIVSWIGALLEWFDFYIYAILAKIIANLYFPSYDPLASLLAAFSALAIGFLFRPLGALLFGKIGDQFGRKIAFLTVIIMMIIGTIGIGILPTYATIGVLASIGIFLLRAIQGLALGGGYGAAITYLGEFAPDDKRGLITGFLFTTPAFGMALAGNIASLLQNHFGIEAFNTYGWRWCFIIAGVFVFIVAIFVQLFYKETPVFVALKHIRRVTSAPIKELFTTKYYFYLFLLAWIGVIGAHGPIWYTNQLYVKYYMEHYGISVGDSGKILAYATYAAIWTYLFFGWLSDKIGRKIILVLGIYGNAILFPFNFWVMKNYINPPDYNMLFLLTFLGTFFNGIGYSGAMSALLLELFPARIRTTAVGFTYNMGYGITGGLTPFIITLLYKFTNNLYLSIILWSTVVPMIMGSFYLIKGWETKGTRVWEELSVKKFLKPILIVSSVTSVGEVIKKMYMEGQRFAIVEVGTYLGIVEERKILKSLAQGITVNDPVRKIAIEVDAVTEDARIIDAVVLLDKFGVEAIPVINKLGKIIGAVESRIIFNEVALLSAGVKKAFTERIRCSEIMKTPPIIIEEEAKLLEAIKVVAEKNIGFLPVVKKDTNKIVGIISEKDLIEILCYNEITLERPIKEYMVKEIITVKPESSVKETLEKIINNNIRHIPVEKNGEVVGIISVKDLLKIL